jgi:pimeloyl-ACP methyl ester carboxylesterase
LRFLVTAQTFHPMPAGGTSPSRPAKPPTPKLVSTPHKTGYASINGLRLYYEIHGTGEPLVLLHGGLGSTEMFGPNLPALAAGRQVIAADLQSHGRTADIERPLTYEAMGDDIAALIGQLGLGRADVMGYSLGAGTALRTAIQHPETVRKLVVVSTPCKRNGWYPEIRAAMAQMTSASGEMMKPSPIYKTYARVAPQPDDWSILVGKVGDLIRREYDWSDEVARIASPVMLVFADSDSIPVAHVAEFYGLLGGSRRDAGWDGSGMQPNRLAVLPGLTHYNIGAAPGLAATVIPFLDAPMPSSAK